MWPAKKRPRRLAPSTAAITSKSSCAAGEACAAGTRRDNLKQILQRLDTGELRVAVAPVPTVSAHELLVEVRASVVSAGTERALVQFGRSNLLHKARQQPEKVKQVLEKAGTDGIRPTLDAVRSKLREPVALGYCSAGVVVEVGAGVLGYSVGDRVATNGPHAEYVRVPQSLVARAPDSVSFEHAAFTPLCAIALQGIRLAAPTLGEVIVVYGLGVVGQLAVQLLRANGCRVIGIDNDRGRLDLAARFGAVPVDPESDRVARVLAETGGVGADAVLLTLASASDTPVHEAAQMSRTRGRLVLVGVTGLDLRRDDFYRKELSFQVSCSYGPGRYDPSYEQGGADYPIGHVRWTEQRNFEAVLALMANGSLDPSPLITHRFVLDRAADAYDLITTGADSLGVVLEYPDRQGAQVDIRDRTIPTRSDRVRRGPRVGPQVAGIIGAGTFAQRVLLPAMSRAGFEIQVIASAGGTSAMLAAERFDAQHCATDTDALFDDPTIGTIFVLTRHDSHASLALRALEAGRNVFVEKPLALSHEDLASLRAAAASSPGILTVGFNRRFAPLTAELQRRLRGCGRPISLLITVNAGFIPRKHWTHDVTVGGGRIAGEACHFIDLARAIVGSPITSGDARSARDGDGAAIDDITHLTLSFADGSNAVIHYLSNGSPTFPKERVEVFAAGQTFVIDNWRTIRPRNRTIGSGLFPRRQDKGHVAELTSWLAAVRAGQPLIPYDEIFEVSDWTLRLAAAARSGD
jgi:predicted dehydrogenase/threonine dehydrogenase-like Zn-dependent dehydrogenase